MELAGDEKRIRALFSELSFEDQSCAPRFERLWSEAKNRNSAGAARVRRFHKPVAVIAFGVACFVAACVLAIWSWSATSTKSPVQNVANVVPQVTPEVPTPAGRDANNPPVRPRSHAGRKQNIKQTVARHRSTEWAATQVETLSRWQSPTNILMASPTGVLFNSLPQLNESAEELKQFLPKNEAMKESNQ
jgi:hypothetical protein